MPNNNRDNKMRQTLQQKHIPILPRRIDIENELMRQTCYFFPGSIKKINYIIKIILTSIFL